HRPAGRVAVAHRDGCRRLVRRREHGEHGRARARSRRARVARGAPAARTPRRSRRRRRLPRRLAARARARCVTLLAASAPSPLWYATRGAGVVTLVLLTVSVCLGVLTQVRWRTTRLPRFVVAGLHRNVTLLAVAFLAVHVATAVADSYAPIGVRDAVVPFLSAYRPIWLGLGALACDLLIAVVLTSLLRVRLGYRLWRVTHWLAYASWPLALVHSLGTGSDARFGWMAALARGLAGAAAIAVPLAVLAWYRSGPLQRGWAGRAGTPTALLASAKRSAVAEPPPAFPHSFTSRLTGTLTQSGPDETGFVTVRIDTKLVGGLRGTLRLALKGFPLDGGGISMTSSGVDFAARGTPVFEGRVLELDLRLDPGTGAVRGSVQGQLL